EDRSVHSPGGVDRLCLSLYLSKSALERDDNLIFVRERLLKGEADRASLLDLYGNIQRGRKVLNDRTNPLLGSLRLSGATRVINERLMVRNRIYARVFDRRWIRMHLPDQERQRQQAAYRRGLARATAMATVIILALGALTLSAIHSEKRAGKAQRLADNKAKQANLLASSLQNALNAVTEQRNRAVHAEQSERAGKKLADKARNQAFAMQSLAEEKTDESRKHLARLYVANGMRLVDEGNLLEALPWLAEALKQDHGNREREEIHRMRLASVLRFCPRLTDLYTQPTGTLNTVTVSRDGRRLATGTAGGIVRIWNLSDHSSPITIRHSGQLISVTFSPDGSRIITASSNHTACIWSSTTGRRITPLLPQGGAIYHTAFSPDGKRVVTAAEDGTACLWDAWTGKQLSPLLRHQDSVTWVEFSPDGNRLATAGRDGGVRLWNGTTGKPLALPIRHSKQVFCVKFSPDGQHLATAGGDGTVRLWDVTTTQEICAPLIHAGPVYTIAFSQDGHRIVTGSSDTTARVWNAATGEPISPPLKHQGGVTCAVFSPDGSRVLTAGQDQTARVWLAASGQAVSAPLLHGTALLSAAFLADGRILTAAQDQSVRVWNLPIRTGIARRQETGYRMNQALFSPNSQRLIVGDGKLTVLNLGTGKLSPPVMVSGNVTQMSFDAEGRRIAVAHGDGTVLVSDTETGRLLLPPLRHKGSIHWIKFTPDGRRLATGGDEGATDLWDTASGKRIAQISHRASSVLCVAVSPGGDRIATGGHERTACLWDAATGRLATPPLLHHSNVTLANFSPDGRRLCTAGGDGRIYLWEVATGKQVFPPVILGGQVLDTVFSQDGRKLVTTNLDGNVRLWDTNTGQSIGSPMHHTGNRPHAVLSPNGRYVLSFSMEGGARVWDAATGEPITPQLGHGGEVVTAAFHSGSNQVLTAEDDGQVDLWNLVSQENSAQNLIRVASFVSGKRVVHESEVEPIEGGELQRDWESFRAAYPGEPAWKPIPAEAWQREEAAVFARQGYRKMALGRLQEAIAMFDKAIEIDPKRPDVWWNRADLEVGAGHLDRALKDYSRVLSLSPDNWRALQSRGDCYRLQRRWKEGVQDYSRALQLRPDFFALWGGRGYLRLFLGEWTGVVQDTTRSIELNPADPGAWINRARARVITGDLAHAERDYLQAIRLQGGVAPWHERALLQLQRHDLSGYRTTCADLLARIGSPENAAIDNHIAWVCALGPNAVADYSSVLRRVERAVAQQRSHSNLNTRGSLLLRSGRFAEARETIQEACALSNGGTPTDWLILAMICHRQGRTEEAQQWLTKAAVEIEIQTRQQPTHPHWIAVLESRLLLTEARSLIGNPPR
ncbi:MAG: High-affnity carbon uptake protein Hat/HatR, partial [Chthonomonadales bacterium]|nr:High-affnity carbon uptake protein Hat/HatR [Chthonomonadales bacterium]